MKSGSNWVENALLLCSLHGKDIWLGAQGNNAASGDY